MKSVGEVMAICRTFRESLQKALRGLEVGRLGLRCDKAKQDLWGTPRQNESRAWGDEDNLAIPNPERIWSIRYAFLAGLSINLIHAFTITDSWFPTILKN